ncbi:PREDICTED: cyclin-D3-1-like [Ipomoea nil]|uniref:cyclin-D3-1-like n=1 Tax=Ipomoea nil TaxID=35883 RepID=UPI000901746D|nr:PREDICTED: cyclin-D3-1-like [Ipomoea nil]
MDAGWPLTSLDALYCEEERCGEVLDWDSEGSEVSEITRKEDSPALFLLDQDLLWEDDELLALFSKELETRLMFEASLSLPRTQAVRWILKVNAHYGFSPLTSILAVNYLDRFLSGIEYQEDKPWMIQLAAVACVSLAAKVEETHVPLLLDFQVEDAEFVFDAKTIQKMELLVLSTLKWRMNPVTPLSFLDHITRRLGLKNHLHWEFFTKCESLILSFMPDSRFVRFLPSVLATATMLHVIHQLEPSNAVDHQNQLLGVLKINKEKVNDCYELIKEVSSTASNKRSYNPSSPSAVVDAVLSCGESSNDSWGSETPAPEHRRPLYKRRRVEEQQMRLPPLMTRVFVDAVASPR